MIIHACILSCTCTFHFGLEYECAGVHYFSPRTCSTDSELIEGVWSKVGECEGEGRGVRTLNRGGGSKFSIVDVVGPGLKGTVT